MDCWFGLWDPYRMTSLWKCFAWSSFRMTIVELRVFLELYTFTQNPPIHSPTHNSQLTTFQSNKFILIGTQIWRIDFDWFWLMMWIMRSLQDDKFVEVFCVRFFQGNKNWLARRFKGFERIDFDWSLQDDKIVEVFCVRFFQGNKYWWARRFEELKGLILIDDVDYEILTGWQDCGSVLREILSR